MAGGGTGGEIEMGEGAGEGLTLGSKGDAGGGDWERTEGRSDTVDPSPPHELASVSLKSHLGRL